MSSEFEILDSFLDKFAWEVEGRSQGEPPEEIRKKLRDFARGALSEEDRNSVIRRLAENPGWIEILAKEALALRAKRPPGDLPE